MNIFDLLVDKYLKLQIYRIISHRFVASYLGNNFIVTLFRFDLLVYLFTQFAALYRQKYYFQIYSFTVFHVLVNMSLPELATEPNLVLHVFWKF